MIQAMNNAVDGRVLLLGIILAIILFAIWMMRKGPPQDPTRRPEQDGPLDDWPWWPPEGP